METILVTGTNRGIGFEFVKQYAKEGAKVFATYSPTVDFKELQDLAKVYKNVVLIPLDVTSERQIMATSKQLQNEKIDILINNAGIGDDAMDLKDASTDTMMKVFKVNTVGPLLMTKHFIAQIEKSQLKTVASITSSMGSITTLLSKKNAKTYVDHYAYRCSKTALNMIMACVALDTQKQNIRVLLLHPGHVKTALGGSTAPIDTFTSVSGMRDVIANAPRSLEKFFYAYDGSLLQW